MTVEFSKTFDQNSSRKSKWLWNSKILLIRIPVGKTNDLGILKDFRSKFQSEKKMTVEFLKTFDQNSSWKSKWQWNFQRHSIRIPVGKANDRGILKDFRSEFQSEKPNWQHNFWRIIQSSVLLIGKVDICQWEKTLINCEAKKNQSNKFIVMERSRILTFRNEKSEILLSDDPYLPNIAHLSFSPILGFLK
jgi:hypothetical protein